MADIGKGDWVEFVGKPPGYVNNPDGWGWRAFEVGTVYLVSEVGRRCEDGAGQVWDSLRVAGAPDKTPSGRPTSTPVAAFKPIYRPRADLIETLLAPAPELEPA